MTSPFDRALHVGDFLRPLVDEQDDESDLGMIRRDRVGERLEDHRLARARRRDDQPALSLADRGHQVEHARGHVARLEADAVLGIEGRQVVEEDLLAGDVRMLEVDRLDLDEGEVALPFLGRPDLAGDRVAGAEVELADLRGRHVDVVRSRKVVVLGGAQESEPVGQALQHALGEDQPLLLGLRLQDLEDQVLLAHSGRVLDLQIFGDLEELRNLDFVECPDVERVAMLDGSRGLLSGRVGKPLGGASSVSTSESLLPLRLAIVLSFYGGTSGEKPAVGSRELSVSSRKPGGLPTPETGLYLTSAGRT